MGSRNSPPVEELLAHTGFVRSLARGALGRDDGSEDVVQDAMLAALERGPDEPQAARSWFYRVVTNRVASLRRKDAVRRRHQQGVRPRPTVPSPAEILAREESRHRLVRALLTLDVAHREPLVLRYYEDLPPRAIAKRLGLPVETVRTRLKRGIAKLRQSLDGEYGSRRQWMVAMVPLTRLPPGTGATPTGAGDSLVTALTSKTAVLGLLAVGALVGAVTWAIAPGVSDPNVPGNSGPTTHPHPEPAPAVLRGMPPADGPHTSPGPAAGPPRASATSRADGYVIRVVDYAGLPVRGAEVRVDERRWDFTIDRVAVRGRTDENGCYSMPRTATPPPGANIPTSSFRLRVTQPPERDDLEDLRIDAWRPGDASLTLSRGFVISGEVVDAGGNPLPGARIRLDAGPRSRSLETDRLGQFRASGLPGARWRTRVDLRRVRAGPAVGEWVLDSGSRAVRLEVSAGRRMLVELPEYAPGNSSHRQLDLRVTEHDPATAADIGCSHHAVSEEGTVWIYDLDETKRYTLWWGPDGGGWHAYAPLVSPERESVTVRMKAGQRIRLKVVRPYDWKGWPIIRAIAPGIEVFGAWDPDGEYVIEGLPKGEFLVTARGNDERGREAFGEIRVRSGGARAIELPLCRTVR